MLNTFFNLLKCLYVKLITHITFSIILSYRYKFIRNFYILMDRICTFFAFQFFNEINSRREM